MNIVILDTYIGTTLPYPDACTAAALCGPEGTCKYKVKTTIIIDKTLLLKNIAFNTARLLGNRVALVIAVLLIWAAFADVDDSFLLLRDDLKNRVQQECKEIGLNLVTNPVDKIAIEPIGSGAELSFVKV